MSNPNFSTALRKRPDTDIGDLGVNLGGHRTEGIHYSPVTHNPVQGVGPDALWNSFVVTGDMVNVVEAMMMGQSGPKVYEVALGVLAKMEPDADVPAEASEDYRVALDALEGMEASAEAIANARDILARIKHHPMLFVSEDEDGAVSVEAFSTRSCERRVWIMCYADQSALCMVRNENDTDHVYTPTYRRSGWFANALHAAVMTLDN